MCGFREKGVLERDTRGMWVCEIFTRRKNNEVESKSPPRSVGGWEEREAGQEQRKRGASLAIARRSLLLRGSTDCGSRPRQVAPHTAPQISAPEDKTRTRGARRLYTFPVLAPPSITSSSPISCCTHPRVENGPKKKEENAPCPHHSPGPNSSPSLPVHLRVLHAKKARADSAECLEASRYCYLREA
ncbi:hypothetical protein B0H13DRAFT_1855219 [Mycena leptocephala]|nr:hypothetical protein B0H13DRAFT_1855219 [Mycena leptocephala]